MIVPVHNAASTIEETLLSATRQVQLDDNGHHQQGQVAHRDIRVFVCCYDDGSTDNSWEIMSRVKDSTENDKESREKDSQTSYLPTCIVLGKAQDRIARGAGYARNRAVDLRKDATTTTNPSWQPPPERYLCMLDSDDIMKPTRIAEQVNFLLSIPNVEERRRTLVGCNFVRDPPDSTWHYAQWANECLDTDERLHLEQFRECTLLQPTWMMARSWFVQLGGYLEAPQAAAVADSFSMEDFCQSLMMRKRHNHINHNHKEQQPMLEEVIHTSYETAETLRVAEDSRFFYKHLQAGGHLRVLRTARPLLVYRHRPGQSQSAQTPRKLLWHIRVRAFEQLILLSANHNHDNDDRTLWQRFCVWGAGRDGKDFVKALRPEYRERIVCMVDVDEKKIALGYYYHKDLGLRIPVVHFSLLARDEKVRQALRNSFEDGSDMAEAGFGRVQKGKDSPPLHNDNSEGRQQPQQESTQQESSREQGQRKRRKVSHIDNLDESILPTLPVVVCVAMYRTGGALEHNVASIQRTEGVDLWHFS